METTTKPKKSRGGECFPVQVTKAEGLAFLDRVFASFLLSEEENADLDAFFISAELFALGISNEQVTTFCEEVLRWQRERLAREQRADFSKAMHAHFFEFYCWAGFYLAALRAGLEQPFTLLNVVKERTEVGLFRLSLVNKETGAPVRDCFVLRELATSAVS